MLMFGNGLFHNFHFERNPTTSRITAHRQLCLDHICACKADTNRHCHPWYILTGRMLKNEMYRQILDKDIWSNDSFVDWLSPVPKGKFSLTSFFRQGKLARVYGDIFQVIACQVPFVGKLAC